MRFLTLRRTSVQLMFEAWSWCWGVELMLRGGMMSLFVYKSRHLPGRLSFSSGFILIFFLWDRCSQVMFDCYISLKSQCRLVAINTRSKLKNSFYSNSFFADVVTLDLKKFRLQNRIFMSVKCIQDIKKCSYMEFVTGIKKIYLGPYLNF